MALETAKAAVAKLAALAEVKPDLAGVARAASEICAAVLDDAHREIAAAKAETLAEIERAAESTEAFQKTIEQRDEAEVKAINLELEVSALRAKSAQMEFHEQTKRVAIAKAAQVVEADAVEKAEVATQVATVAAIVYLNKAVRNVYTGKSFIDSPRRASGPWECKLADGSVVIEETRKDAVDLAIRLATEAVKSAPAELDPMTSSHLDGKKKPHMFPETGADMGSNDTFDSTSKRVAISKRASGKRVPRYKR